LLATATPCVCPGICEASGGKRVSAFFHTFAHLKIFGKKHCKRVIKWPEKQQNIKNLKITTGLD